MAVEHTVISVSLALLIMSSNPIPSREARKLPKFHFTCGIIEKNLYDLSCKLFFFSVKLCERYVLSDPWTNFYESVTPVICRDREMIPPSRRLAHSLARLVDVIVCEMKRLRYHLSSSSDMTKPWGKKFLKAVFFYSFLHSLQIVHTFCALFWFRC